MHGRGGPNTAAADGPGGPIVAGDHRRLDSPRLTTPGSVVETVNHLKNKKLSASGCDASMSLFV